MTTINSQPTPTSLTLLAKNEKTTILLYAQATDTLASLKSQIHAHVTTNALRLLDSLTIPDTPEDIVLALQGPGTDEWVEIADQDKRITTVGVVGIRDGGAIAWRVGGEDFVVEVPRDEEGDGELE